MIFALLGRGAAQTVQVDHEEANDGGLAHGIAFGVPHERKVSGDGTGAGFTQPGGITVIASPRKTGSPNLFGLNFSTNNRLSLSITASGQIGVGTATPSKQLEVRGTGDVEIGLQSNDAGARLWTIQSTGTGKGGLDANFQIYDRTANISRLQIDSTGLVSVNTLRITGGTDMAEPFAFSDQDVVPGSVVVIDNEHPGQLRLSSAPYDKRVAGVISGAGGIHPALMLTRAESTGTGGASDTNQNVALSGRVYVLADASGGAIKPGDLLTTSNTSGHCMRAADYERARGSILGKAMSSLPEGKGLVLALVTLQ
jgi:hypothetical protein